MDTSRFRLAFAFVSVLALSLLLVACQRRVDPDAARTSDATWETEHPLPTLDASVVARADLAKLGIRLTPEKVRLGRALFFDPRLSVDSTVSCATCHRPERAFSDVAARAVGVHGRVGRRKSMTIVNVTQQHREDRAYFWDGRAASLAEQAVAPIVSPDEMGFTREGVVARIGAIAGYRRMFAAAYGDGPVTIDHLADALVAYEATRVSRDAPADRFDRGDKTALSLSAARGRALFEDKAGCALCHFGPDYADAQFHNLGIGWDAAQARFDDPGRAAVTERREDTGKFRTPTLRDVSKHAPYMHDGSLPTLRAVVEHYDRGGTANPWIDRNLEPLGLSASEVDDLVAFLESLDGEGYGDTPPAAFPQ
jgi:cytochrome c peroxidase